MNWQLFQGIPHLVPNVSWDRVQPSYDPSYISCDRQWMDVWMDLSFQNASMCLGRSQFCERPIPKPMKYLHFVCFCTWERPQKCNLFGGTIIIPCISMWHKYMSIYLFILFGSPLAGVQGPLIFLGFHKRTKVDLNEL